MPRALALETSGRIGSIALAIDGRVQREIEFEHGLQNAAKILPIIDQLCREQNWKPADIEHVYVSVGPGSFTGLRIGVTIAKTLSLSIGAKVVAVPSANVLVRNAPFDSKHAIIVLDAKRGQIFTARFERVGSVWIEREPAHVDRLADILARSPRPLHLIGEGIEFHRQAIPASDAQILVTDASCWRAKASVVAQLGHEASLRNELADADRLTPIYIRLPEAEEKWIAAKSAEQNQANRM